MGPNWFDWLSLSVTVLAAVAPAWLAIALWRSDRRDSIRERRAAATREFTNLLAVGDRVLVRFRDVSFFAEAMGSGSWPLLSLIHRYMEWDDDEEREDQPRDEPSPSTSPRAPRLDLSVEVSATIWRWNRDPAYRADLTEVVLANGEVFPEPADNLLISPKKRRAVEDEVMSDPHEYREWLAGTRLAPSRIRYRRFCDKLRFGPLRSKSPAEPLNPLATSDYLQADAFGGDDWLRERSTVPPEERDW